MADDVQIRSKSADEVPGKNVSFDAVQGKKDTAANALETSVDQLMAEIRTGLLRTVTSHIAKLEQENERLRAKLGSNSTSLVSLPMKRYGGEITGDAASDEVRLSPNPMPLSIQVQPCSGGAPDDNPSLESENQLHLMVDMENIIDAIDGVVQQADSVSSKDKEVVKVRLPVRLEVHDLLLQAEGMKNSRSSSDNKLLRGMTAQDDELFYSTLKQLNERVADSSDNAENDFVDMEESTLHPMSVEILVFDFLFLAMLCVDFVRIPWQLLLYNENVLADVFDWTCRIMWTMQLGRSAVTGFVKQDGTLEMRFPHILSNYFYGWFAFDFAFTALQWLELLAKDDLDKWSDAKVLRITHAARMFRLVRLIQVVRVPNYLLPMTQLIFNEWAVLVVGIGKMMVLFLGLIHYIACGYYGLGIFLERRGYETWVKFYDLENKPLSVRYVYSMHWSMTNILGEGEVMPANAWERAYTTIALFMLFVVSSYVMSTITASLTQINNIQGQHAMQLVRLRQFLANMEISTALTARVLYCAKYIVKEKERNLSNNRDLLACMSEPLRLQVVHEAYVPTLCNHCFFRWFNDFDLSAMLDLADNAVFNMPVTVGDVLFAKGEQPADPAMMFVMRGSCLYLKGDEGFYLPESHWCLEKVLWLQKWRRVGTLRGASNCAVLCVDANGLRKMAIQFESRAQVVREYAKLYVQDLQKKHEGGEHFNDVSDDINVEVLTKVAFRGYEGRNTQTSSSSGRPTMLTMSSRGTPNRASNMLGHSALYRLVRKTHRRTVKESFRAA